MDGKCLGCIKGDEVVPTGVYVRTGLPNHWKGGDATLEERKKEWNLTRKNKRHATGVNKKYIEFHGKSKTKEFRKLYAIRNHAMDRHIGEITINTIQMLYEENIKKYGTLTCYLCLEPIQFNKDSIDHKIPGFRGGTNDYENLGIAHISCNCSKRTKTEEEYKEWRIKNGKRTQTS